MKLVDEMTVDAAVGIWMGWPLLLEAYENRRITFVPAKHKGGQVVTKGEAREQTPNERHTGRVDLAHDHQLAARWLIKAAERFGFDGSPLWAEAQYCQTHIMTGNYELGPRDAFSTWPEVLGRKRYELPEAIQATITAGEAVFIRVVSRLEIEEEHPKSGKTKLAGKEKTNSSTTIERDTEWLNEWVQRQLKRGDIARFAREKGKGRSTVSLALKRAKEAAGGKRKGSKRK